jgi:ADP-ribose pyrophosphatase YjhB (NUDIX family)
MANIGRDAAVAEPCETLEQLSQTVVRRLGSGAERRGGERFVPLDVWQSQQFQAWYRELVDAGNRLDHARVLWTFYIPQAGDFLFCYALQVKVWVAEERRHKTNEFILSRPDISCICAYAPDERTHNWLDTKVVLVKEFRSPARTPDGFLHDLPGGSGSRPNAALQVASEELAKETGLELPAERFHFVTARQMAATFGTHKAHVFSVKLTHDEMARMEERSADRTVFGVTAETERTYVEVRTLREILNDSLLDHASVGIITQACLGPRAND